MKRLIIVLCILSLPVLAHAEIEKLAEICKEQICFYWWPKLTAVKGWHHERQTSLANSINIQVPDGSTFSNAETVIYAKALYKPRVPAATSLEKLIDDDKNEFLAHDPTIIITEVAATKTGDGKSLRSLTFFPKTIGNWEQVSYGEEGDFYLIFTVSSRTKEGFEKALEVYKQYIGRYEETP